METFRLDGYVWTVQPKRLTVQATWKTYAIGCVVAFVVLVAAVLIVRSVVADPNINVGGSRSVSGTKIDWAKQTLSQRAQHLTCVALGLAALIALPLAYLFGGFQDRRNPLTFDKSTDQICKGERVLATLSSVISVAKVNVKIAKPLMQSRAQIFIRFDAEPWSFQFVSYSRDKTADRVAVLLANFLSVPIVQDPIQMQRPSSATSRLR